MGGEAQNPRKWRFTWEAQSLNPTLKLFLFNPSSQPVVQSDSLRVQSNPARSTIHVSFTVDSGQDVALSVTIPRVLIDGDSPLSSRALDDHIEVKLPLLLPVDHPLMSSLHSVLSLSGDGEETLLPDAPKPLSTGCGKIMDRVMMSCFAGGFGFLVLLLWATKLCWHLSVSLCSSFVLLLLFFNRCWLVDVCW